MNRNGKLALAKSQRGFTLVELMVTIAILAILATIGLPSFQRLIADYRVSSQANGVQGLLQFARSEAVKRRQSVSVCLGDGTLVARVGLCADAAQPLRVLPLNQRVDFGGFDNTFGVTFASSGFLFLPVDTAPPTLTFSASLASDREIPIMRSGHSEIIKD